MFPISGETIRRLLSRPGSATIRIYLAVLVSSDRIVPGASMRLRDLMQATGLSERTVFASLAELQAIGILQKEHGPGRSLSLFRIADLIEVDAAGLQSTAAPDPYRDGYVGFVADEPVADGHRVANDPGTTVHCIVPEDDGERVEDAAPAQKADGWRDTASPLARVSPPSGAGSGTKPAATALHGFATGWQRASDSFLHSTAPLQDAVAPFGPAVALQGSSEMDCDGNSEGREPDETVLLRVAARYRPLTAEEKAIVDAFIDDWFAGNRGRFLAAADLIQPGVAPDAPLGFLLAAVEYADRCLSARRMQFPTGLYFPARLTRTPCEIPNE